MSEVQVMLLRCPELFTYSLQRQVCPAVAFLAGQLGLAPADVRSVLLKYPPVLSLGVKGHLAPQVGCRPCTTLAA